MNTQTVNTLADRLIFALEQNQVSQAELARRINVKRQAIQYLCSSGTSKSKFAYDIAEALNINVDWLVTGNGEMNAVNSAEQKLLAEKNIVPILQWNQIAKWLDNAIDKNEIKDWTVVHEKINPCSFALTLKDNAMFPRFPSETIIAIDPNKALKYPCFVLVYVKKLHETVFRYLVKDNEKLILHAFNETGYKQIPLSSEDKVLGCMFEAKWLIE